MLVDLIPTFCLLALAVSYLYYRKAHKQSRRQDKNNRTMSRVDMQPSGEIVGRSEPEDGVVQEIRHEHVDMKPNPQEKPVAAWAKPIVQESGK